MLPEEDRRLAADFARHFGEDFRKAGFERPEEALAVFAMRLPVHGAPRFEERLVLAHALLLAVADMPGKTWATVQDRIMGIARKKPHLVTKERRRRALDFLRRRRVGEEAQATGPTVVTVVCPDCGKGYAYSEAHAAAVRRGYEFFCGAPGCRGRLVTADGVAAAAGA